MQHVNMKQMGQSSVKLSFSALKRKAVPLCKLPGDSAPVCRWVSGPLCWSPTKPLESTYCSFLGIFAAESSLTRCTLYYEGVTDVHHQGVRL